MKKFLLIAGIVAYVAGNTYAATCSPNCKACKNCKYCKRCSKQGGTCSVCKKS